MIHLYRVYFDSIADAVQLYAESRESVEEYVDRKYRGREPVVRYVKSVTKMRTGIPLVMSGRECDEQGI